MPKKADEPTQEVDSSPEQVVTDPSGELVGGNATELSKGEGASEAAEAFFGSAPEGAPGGPETVEDQVARYARRPTPWRSPTLLILVIGVSAWLLWSMRADLAYFVSEPEAVNLGDMDLYDLSGAAPNAYVAIAGLPHHLQAQYKQLGTRYKVYPLIGTRIFVRERLSAEARPTSEYPSFEGRGRLLDIRQNPTYSNVRSFFSEKGRFSFDEPAWILLVGEIPRRAFWIPIAYLVVGGILLLNLGLLGRRLLRRPGSR